MHTDFPRMRLRVFPIVAATLVVGIVVGAWIARQRGELRPTRPATATGDTPLLSAASPTTAVSAHSPSPSATDDFAKPEPISANHPPPLTVVFGAPAWEEQVKSTIAREPEPAARSRALLAMLPKMPQEALAEITEKAVDQLPDEAYASTALPVVTNPATHGQVMSVLFADLMERPDAITLPALLQIARNPQHAFGPSAVDNLKLLLRVDRGTDWAAWEKDVAQRVAAGR